MVIRAATKTFKPRARMMILLGEQLIRDSGIAVFELVKNAYDADSPDVEITMYNIEDPSNARIIIQDRGIGMDFDTVNEVWLEPGTDYRAMQKLHSVRTPKFRRLPLGEKGIGRFAVHKLGKYVKMVTRKAGCPEVVVKIDWSDFESFKYLKDVGIKVVERDQQVFKGRKTGTRIEIKNLNDKWARGMIRDLHRSVFSICSPFSAPDDFVTILKLEPDPGWLKGLLTHDKVREYSMFNLKGEINGNALTYNYFFSPLLGMSRIEGREIINKTVLLREIADYPRLNNLKIGPIKIDLQIFDQDPQVLSLGVSDRKGFKEFLKHNGGIRVYRDGIRVYDYGEPGSDWLDLGTRRVNVPSGKISNNIVIGAVSLSVEKSSALVEKTNREGFIENDAYKVFKNAVLGAVATAELERNIDKIRIRQVYGGKKKQPVTDELMELRQKIEKKNLGDDVLEMVEKINNDFLAFRDTLLTAAGAGLSLVVVVHEVEKGVKQLDRMLEEDADIGQIRELARHLTELVDGLTYISKKSERTKERASTLVKQALFNTSYRLKTHKISIINGFKEKDDPDFSIKCTRRLIVATLMNLIDNSIYWINTRKALKKFLYIGTTNDLKEGPAIVVADSGTGFSDLPEYLTQPFITRKPDGMGLGLYLASEVMKVHEGIIIFPEPGDVDIPEKCNGAVVALAFGGAKNERS